MRGVEGRYWNEKVTARPNGLREKVETAVSCRGLGPARKKNKLPVVERRRTWLQICAPCGTTESRTHIVGECEIYREGRNALEDGMRKLDVCDMKEFGRLESSEKTIAILRDKWWPQAAKQDGDRISKQFLCRIWKKRNERQMLDVSLLGVGTVLRLERDAWSMVIRLRPATNDYAPPPPYLGGIHCNCMNKPSVCRAGTHTAPPKYLQ